MNDVSGQFDRPAMYGHFAGDFVIVRLHAPKQQRSRVARRAIRQLETDMGSDVGSVAIFGQLEQA